MSRLAATLREQQAFLRALPPRLLPRDRSFEVHPFQSKFQGLAGHELTYSSR